MPPTFESAGAQAPAAPPPPPFSYALAKHEQSCSDHLYHLYFLYKCLDQCSAFMEQSNLQIGGWTFSCQQWENKNRRTPNSAFTQSSPQGLASIVFTTVPSFIEVQSTWLHVGISLDVILQLSRFVCYLCSICLKN